MGNRLPRTKRKLKSAIKRDLKKKLRAERAGKTWSPERHEYVEFTRINGVIEPPPGSGDGDGDR